MVQTKHCMHTKPCMHAWQAMVAHKIFYHRNQCSDINLQIEFKSKNLKNKQTWKTKCNNSEEKLEFQNPHEGESAQRLILDWRQVHWRRGFIQSGSDTGFDVKHIPSSPYLSFFLMTFFIHSFISLFHSFIHLSIHPFILSSIPSSLHSLIHSLMHWCIHSFILSPPIKAKSWRTLLRTRQISKAVDSSC